MTADPRGGVGAVRAHLSEELGIDASAIEEGSRFKEDLEADSLDLVELVMELEDRYGIRITEEEAERIKTVGQAIDFVLSTPPPTLTPERSAETSSRSARRAARGPCARRRSPIPPGWSDRADSYERLAFLGDSVLSISVSTALFPALQRSHGRPADQDPRADGQQALLRGGGAGDWACPSACARPRRRATRTRSSA